MSWLSNEAPALAPPGERLAQLWRDAGILKIPGAHHPLAGLLAKRAGFQALYLSGAALSASLGLADLGILGLDEVAFFTRMISRATGLPLVVDADTGFGGILNVMRAVRELEDAGAAAIQIEDQHLPKKCGHLNDKRLVPAEEMAAKITAAVRARRHLKIIARTDAVGVEGLEAALGRARLYRQAGADAIFPEALGTADMFQTFAREIEAPLLANMTEFGRTPHFTAQQFEDFGFKMVIFPVSSLRIAAAAIGDLYQTLMRDGTAETLLDRMQTRADLYDTIGYHDYEALDQSIARSVVPPAIRRKS
ncbi:MAG TPA: methylisocitrate lyase [Candidatus Binataceae bacterium]|jgi:methylisocitrate lyase|nr:methylisocitrate lyase [Candidatus Binataceae bacterium]